MEKHSYTGARKSKLSACAKQWVALVLVIMIGILISTTVNAQHTYHKQKARHYKSRFRSQVSDYTHACNILEKKKNQKPKSSSRFASGRKSESRPIAEVKPVVLGKANETPRHEKDDKVLNENRLPAPTSTQHQIIREMVAQNLKERKGNEPIELAPLYFNHNEDELSVADMNPFLIAAEFALQGRTIRIEDHTTSYGIDSYNIKLSTKIVQKVRQLMHDMGVPDDRILVVSYGDEVAQHDNKFAGSKLLNGRVNFKAF